MNARRALGAVLALAGLGALIAVMVVAQPAIARDQALSSAPVLARAQTPADLLPDDLGTSTLGDGGLVESSARLIGETVSTSFWVALDASSNVCLVAQSREEGQLSAATCPSAQNFATRGAWLQVVSNKWSVEAQLNPIGAEAPPVNQGWSRVSGNLFVSTPEVRQ